MSQHNVELIRSVYDAWDKNESARAFLAEDIEYVNASYAVEPGIRLGRKSLAAVRDTYEDFQVHVERFLDAGDDVVVLARYTASGRGSGVPVGGEHTATCGPFVTDRPCGFGGSSPTRKPSKSPASRSSAAR